MAKCPLTSGFLWAKCPSTNSIKALKETHSTDSNQWHGPIYQWWCKALWQTFMLLPHPDLFWVATTLIIHHACGL